jgi:dienelactone hydrolase
MPVAGTGGGGEAGSGGGDGEGCAGSTLLTIPEDTSMRGPWPVGQRTVQFGRFTAVEIMYPAMPGSEQGMDPLTYDLRTWLPTAEQSKVPDEDATIISADTYRDLPIDEAHGPYPVIILVHGTAAFRVASFSTQAHWASRGFVVVAADHPNLFLTDYLKINGCAMTAPSLNLSADVDSEITTLTAASGDLAFLSGHIDMQRVGLAGHSAGAYAVADYANKPGVKIIVPLAGTKSVRDSSSLESVVFVSGMADAVLPYASGVGRGSLLYPGTTTSAYMGSASPKRMIGITGGGHLVPTDLCKTGPSGMPDLTVANMRGVCGTQTIVNLGLADCGTVDRVMGTDAVNGVTTAAFEETLQCQDRSAFWSGVRQRYPVIGDLQQAM